MLTTDGHPTSRPAIGGPHVDAIPSAVKIHGDTEWFPFTVTLTKDEDGTPLLEIDTYNGAEPNPQLHNAACSPYLRVWVNLQCVYENNIDGSPPWRQ